MVLWVKTSWGTENVCPTNRAGARVLCRRVQERFPAAVPSISNSGALKTSISYRYRKLTPQWWYKFSSITIPPKYVRIGETFSWHLVGLQNAFSEKDLESGCKIELKIVKLVVNISRELAWELSRGKRV